MNINIRDYKNPDISVDVSGDMAQIIITLQDDAQVVIEETKKGIVVRRIGVNYELLLKPHAANAVEFQLVRAAGLQHDARSE
jgi:hypothetical protein